MAEKTRHRSSIADVAVATVVAAAIGAVAVIFEGVYEKAHRCSGNGRARSSGFGALWLLFRDQSLSQDHSRNEPIQQPKKHVSEPESPSPVVAIGPSLDPTAEPVSPAQPKQHVTVREMPAPVAMIATEAPDPVALRARPAPLRGHVMEPQVPSHVVSERRLGGGRTRTPDRAMRGNA